MPQSTPDFQSRQDPWIPLPIQRVTGGMVESSPDLLAVEEPLEIRISHVRQGKRRQRTISVTMRTPGHDRELAAGYLLTEGILQQPRDLLAMYSCRNGNRVRVHLRDDVVVNTAKLQRHFYTSSSCGVCGKTSLEAVRSCVTNPLPATSPVVSTDLIHALPDKLRTAQAVFNRTGGLHASALFDHTGQLICLREDVGRHNALDKVIGRQFMRGNTPLTGSILLVSGRASFELVQKAVMAGIPMLAAVGAPSSLAVKLAEEHGLTLLGFVREDRFNIYAGSQRIRMANP